MSHVDGVYDAVLGGPEVSDIPGLDGAYRTVLFPAEAPGSLEPGRPYVADLIRPDSIGMLVSCLRTMKGWSMPRAASKIGCAQATVSAAEAGQIELTATTAGAFCRALGERVLCLAIVPNDEWGADGKTALLLPINEKDDHVATTGKLLRSLRKWARQTQPYVGERAGMGQGAVSRMETRGTDVVSRIERYLGALDMQLLYCGIPDEQ